MSDKSRTLRLALLTLGLALAAGVGSPARARQQNTQGQTPPAQDEQEEGQDEEATRQIKSSDFTKKRPAAPAPNSAKSAPAPKSSGAGADSAAWVAPTYRRVKPARRKTPPRTNSPAAAPARKPDPAPAATKRPDPVEVKDVGVTLWRLRLARETDTGPGFQLLQGGKTVLMTPERVESTAEFSIGDFVRLSIESPRDGYLYVINREQYADDTVGAPVLIFPSRSIRGGDNKVSAGRLVDIPDAGDPPFFKLTSNQRAGQPQNVGELITILISPRPLEGVTPGRTAVALDPAQFAKWEDAWEGPVNERLEMNGGAGRAWTAEEKQAGEATRSLTQADPTPQTIYRVAGRPGEPLMVTVQMVYGAATAAPTTAAPTTQSGASTPPRP